MARLRGSWPEAEASPGPETFHVEHGRVRKVPIPRLLRPAWEGGTFHVEQDAGRDGASSGARSEGGGKFHVGHAREGFPTGAPTRAPIPRFYVEQANAAPAPSTPSMQVSLLKDVPRGTSSGVLFPTGE